MMGDSSQKNLLQNALINGNHLVVIYDYKEYSISSEVGWKPFFGLF